ncbi:MAG: hypothetical protein M3374_05160 [Pseudomonadota bacterium]|nr:hypothetical protein [Pseudomonadota bacterium]
MNSRLHNTITALRASGAMLVLGLVVAVPIVPESAQAPTHRVASESSRNHPAAAVHTAEALVVQVEAELAALDAVGFVDTDIELLADAVALTAEIATATALATALEQVSAVGNSESNTRSIENPSPRQARKTTRRNRQTFVMPYFSFAPRG